MKKLLALFALFAAVSFAFAVETAKAKPTEKPKAEAKSLDVCGEDGCCDDEPPATEAKTAKATEQKSNTAKKDAAKPIAKK